jgi:hypothetical protein
MKNDVNSSKLQNLTIGLYTTSIDLLTHWLQSYSHIGWVLLWYTTSVEVRMLAHTHLPLCPKIVTAICTHKCWPKDPTSFSWARKDPCVKPTHMGNIVLISIGIRQLQLICWPRLPRQRILCLDSYRA